MSEIKLSRKELYEVLWTNPIQDIAKEYGLGEAQLRHICLHYRIPLPNLKFWDRNYKQNKLKRKKLPIDNIKETEVINIYGPMEYELRNYVSELTKRTKDILKHYPIESISSKRLGSNADPLVKSLQEDLAAKKPIDWRHGIERAIK